MAYTAVWDETVPLGTVAANTIDDLFRALKRDLRERDADYLDLPSGSAASFAIDPLRPYGLRFTNSANATLYLGNNGGTPRLLNIKDYLGVTTYFTFGSVSLDIIGALNFTINTNKFTVAGATGNTVVAGTLSVTGTSVFGSAVIFGSSVGVTGDFAVNTNKFTVNSTNGNTLVAGTLSVTGAATFSSTANVVGDFSVNTNKFNVAAATGNTLIAGTLGIVGDVAINTNKFTVTASNGNTLVAGTLSVTGLINSQTISAAANFTGSLTVANGFTITAGTSAVQALTATTGLFSSTLGVTGDFAVNTNKFTVTASNGNTLVAGTLAVTGAATLSSTLGVTGTITGANVSLSKAGADNTLIMQSANGIDISTFTITTSATGSFYGGYSVIFSGSQLNGGAVGYLFVTTSRALFITSAGTAIDQFKIGYDASNYYTTTVSATGGVTFDAVGAGAGFAFTDNNFSIGGAVNTTVGLLVQNTTTAASAAAYGIRVTSSLTAAANNDTLYGAQIFTTMANGGFTGVGFVDLALVRATGTATIVPITLRLRSTGNAGDWDTATNWANLDFYSDDQTGAGVGVRARIGSRMMLATGASTGMYLAVTSGSGLFDVLGLPGGTALGDVTMTAAGKFFVDGIAGAGNTYITEAAADDFQISVGGSILLRLLNTSSTQRVFFFNPATITNMSDKNIGVANGTAPTGNPTNAFYMWAETGAGKGRGTGGTVTTFIPA